MNAAMQENDLRAAIDRHGADLAHWPDGALAQEVRAALLAHRGLRSYWEGAASLERALAGARDAVDREVAASGAAGRVLRAVAARPTAVPRWSPRSWAAAAAALVVAAGLGSLIDYTVIGSNESAYETVVIDPLVFGTVETQ